MALGLDAAAVRKNAAAGRACWDDAADIVDGKKLLRVITILLLLLLL